MITKYLNYDFVVVGGGFAGVCTAIAAARHGVKTALVQDRSMLGGNASSEMRVHVNGAGRDGGFKNAIESGIVMEILLANKKVNPQHSYHVFDNVVWEKANFQENLDVYLNTSMREVEMDGSKIAKITAYQSMTETKFVFSAKYFSDNTGDATLSYLAGADYTIGHEAKSTYNESLAPDEANEFVMGSSVLFSMKDMGKPTPFKRPDWAYKYTKEMRGKRAIPELTHGYWWVELDGEIEKSQYIRDELVKYAYGVFDYIKNSGEFPESENLVLDWISSIAGKRESRRVYGDYVLNQNDIDESKRFENAVAYGGWTMDDHTVGGITATADPQNHGTIWHEMKDIYTIPYTCIYSRNVDNLFIGGRAISASHMALSSTRVMGTCSVLGQAAGTAVSIALRENITPREVSKHIKELQQTLIKDDCYIPGIAADDKLDLVTNLDCKITASSETEKGKATNINGDYARRVDEVENAWISETLSENGEYIKVEFPKSVELSQLILRFDPNFSNTTIITQSWRKKEAQAPEMPYEMVRDYSIIFENDGKTVKTMDVDDNFQRVNKFDFDKKVVCDSMKILVKTTYGDKHARIFDIRAYE
ncbi:MAG: FAD-dependent oxidoreductase [Clostridia bacterium]